MHISGTEPSSIYFQNMAIQVYSKFQVKERIIPVVIAVYYMMILKRIST